VRKADDATSYADFLPSVPRTTQRTTNTTALSATGAPRKPAPRTASYATRHPYTTGTGSSRSVSSSG
jgi:hypothetical protein